MSGESEAQGDARGSTALVLQGGGALGAYQAGAVEALGATPRQLDWVAGISIGAITAALIAGNPPEKRISHLRAFWELVSLRLPWHPARDAPEPLRIWWDSAMAWWGSTGGVPGFFHPRPVWNWWPQPPASLYDTSPLRQTLLEMVDFDYLNDGPIRFSVGAVDVQSGNFTYFDNRIERIGPEHVMASGALPPGFGAVRIGERWYWDGGMVSNTPLAYVMDHLAHDRDAVVTIFQIDLFNARGKLPDNLGDTQERMKDIQYSSRTRFVSDLVHERHGLHQRLHRMAALLPVRTRNSPQVRELLADTQDPAIDLVHVIHRRKPFETLTKDYEFSHLSMDEHWEAGRADMDASLALLRRQKPLQPGEFRVLDHQPDRSMARRPSVRKPVFTGNSSDEDDSRTAR